jgi:lactaldehyde reductase
LILNSGCFSCGFSCFHAAASATRDPSRAFTPWSHVVALISLHLRDAVANKPSGREGMALGQYIAGMGFSNVGLGVDHSMAHGLSALYDMPHGKACAILLPTVMKFNAPATGTKYRAIATAMGVKGVEKMTLAQARKAAVAAVEKLAKDVGIPADLKGVLKKEDVPFLAVSAYADACRPGNPRDCDVKTIAKLYKSLM